jgi:hypothetical protein
VRVIVGELRSEKLVADALAVYVQFVNSQC